MISVVHYFNAQEYSKELDDMFLARCDVFTERLGWVPSMNDREVDQFDTYRSSPTYIIVTDSSGTYQGSLRLIPTDRPNMLANVFPYVVPEELIPHSNSVLEISRIHMVQRLGTPRKRGINIYLGELFAGLGEWAIHIGCYNMVTVVDERMLRVIKLAGANPTLLHPEGYLQDDGIKCFVVSLNRDNFTEIKKSFNIEDVYINE